MFECLVQHGCADLSSALGNGQYSALPIDNGGFGDVWRVTLSSGILRNISEVAVKTLRLKTLLEGNDIAAKVGICLRVDSYSSFGSSSSFRSVQHVKYTAGAHCATPTFRSS